MPRLYLDENGKPYTLESWSEKKFVQIPYDVTDKDGKVVSKQSKIEEKTISHEERNYDISEWKKDLIFRELRLIRGYDRKPKSSLLIPKTALFVVSFKIDANKMTCACGNPHVYVRAMQSGLFRCCASCGITSGSMCTSESFYKSEGIEKVDETEVSASQAIELFKSEFIHYCDIDLRRKLGLPD